MSVYVPARPDGAWDEARSILTSTTHTPGDLLLAGAHGTNCVAYLGQKAYAIKRDGVTSFDRSAVHEEMHAAWPELGGILDELASSSRLDGSALLNLLLPLLMKSLVSQFATVEVLDKLAFLIAPYLPA